MSHKRHEPCCHENMVKSIPVYTMKVWWNGGNVYTRSTPRRQMGMSVQHHAPAAYFGESGPSTHRKGSWRASGLTWMLWTNDRSVSPARNRTPILWTSSSQPSPRRHYVHMKLGSPKFLKFEIFLVSDRIIFQGLYLWIEKRKQVIPVLCKSQRKCGRGRVLPFAV
jgi:hypothetical protein